MRIPAAALALILASGCMQETTGSEQSAEGGAPSEENYITFHDKLAKLFRVKPEELPRAYALMKDGLAGRDWLVTVHGLADNKTACEEMIAPYNADESMSTLPGRYICVEINGDFVYPATLAD